MPCSSYGRIGQTLVGPQAPRASTSGRVYWLPASIYLRRKRFSYRLRPCAQLQQEEGQKEDRQTSRSVKSFERRKESSKDTERHEHSSSANYSEELLTSPTSQKQPPSGNWLLDKWEALAPQYRLVFACAWAFVICNMDKVNISVAIITMSRDFNWSSTTSGIVQSSFFAGYMFTQIPGGYIVSRLGGRKVLPTGVSLWSAATAATPLLAGSLPGILLCRIAVGLGEGVAPTSATDMVARVCKQSERSRAIGFIFSGLHVGSLAGLLVAPVLIERLGWPAVFYMFGAAGLLWSGWWESLMGRIKQDTPEVASRLETSLENVNKAAAVSNTENVPWRAILRNTPVRALSYVHFCNNWAAYTMTAWLPSYFSNSLSLDLTQASQAALFPPIAAIAASAVAGPVADHVISQGAPVAPVRKTAQAVAFIGPSIFLGFACKLAGGGADNEMLTVGLISGALGLASVSIAGLYSNHADLSPRQASVLLGITNTMGAIPGIIGVTFTGVVFDKTHDWNWALFAPSIFFWLTGAIIFALFGSADEQTFEDDTPFWFEKYFQPAVQLLAKLPIGSVTTSLLTKAQAVQRTLKRKS